MFALAIVVTVLLLLESLPSAGAQLPRTRPGLTRLDELTRLGVLHLAGSGLAVAGLFVPAAGAAGGALEAVVFGWVLSRQVSYGDRGRALTAYLLFAAFALAVLAVDLARL